MLPKSLGLSDPTELGCRMVSELREIRAVNMDYLLWSAVTALWLMVAFNAASKPTPLLLLDRTHKL